MPPPTPDCQPYGDRSCKPWRYHTYRHCGKVSVSALSLHSILSLGIYCNVSIPHWLLISAGCMSLFTFVVPDPSGSCLSLAATSSTTAAHIWKYGCQIEHDTRTHHTQSSILPNRIELEIVSKFISPSFSKKYFRFHQARQDFSGKIPAQGPG